MGRMQITWETTIRISGLHIETRVRDQMMALHFMEEVIAILQKGLAVVLLRHAPLMLCGVCGCLALVALACTHLALFALKQEHNAFTDGAIAVWRATLSALNMRMLPLVEMMTVGSVLTRREEE
jgi:hypothetical protein